MYERIIVTLLLLATSACAPPRVAQLRHPNPTPRPAFQSFAATDTRFELSDPHPGGICKVGTNNCMSSTEMMSMGPCLLSSGRCKFGGQIQPAIAPRDSESLALRGGGVWH
jgi:hypothetical protein